MKQPPEPDPTDTLRQVSQPQRELARWLQRQFANGSLKSGGKVILKK